MRQIDSPDSGSRRLPSPGISAEWSGSQAGREITQAPAHSQGVLKPDRGMIVVPRETCREARAIDIKVNEATVPRPRESIAPGQVLRERYLVEKCLGVGGKGTVFRARDLMRSKSLPEAEQYVALKVLHAGPDPEQALEQLRSELHCAQALSHANIVNVYELDRDGEVVFFTMELLEGELLSAVLAKHRPAPIDREQAWQMIRQIGAGLQHAHERGVVHGDLKPSNIMMTREGELRILDFGSSRRVAPGTNLATLTGRSSATLAYASCEQLEGRPPDPRDDLYAFACICFELLGGTHPFDRRPASLVRDFGVVPKRPAGLSARQWRILQKGVSWHRAARSVSAQAFVQCLVRDRDEEPRVTRLEEVKGWTPRQPEWHARAPVLVMAALLAVGACVTQWGATPGPQGAPSVERVTNPGDAMVAADEEAGAVPESVERAWAAEHEPEPATESVAPVKPVVRHVPMSISVEGYHVAHGDRFVEIRVGRNVVGKDASFTWWTEGATAQQGRDYVPQSKAIQTFGNDRRSTRLYVKLMPDSQRSQRDYFFLAINQPGSKRPDAVTRTAIWLPIPRGQLQASR